MNMKRLLGGFCMVAAVALLAGCGGNGGNGIPPTNGDGGDTPPPAPLVTIAPDVITQALVGLLPSDMTIPHTQPVTIPAGGTTDIGPATFSCPAGGGACTVEAYTERDGTFVVKATEGVTVAASQAAQGRKASADDAAALAPALALADDDGDLQKITAMTDLPGTGKDNEPFGITEDLKTVVGTDTLGEDDKDKDGKSIENQFAAVTGVMPAALTGFSGSVYERMTTDAMGTTDDMTDDVTTTDTLTVYTNQEPPGNSTYSEWYSDTAAKDRDGVQSGAMGVLTLSIGMDTGDSTLFDSAWFPTPVSGSSISTTTPENVANDPDDPENLIDESAFAGKFNNIDGMYSCASGTCTATYAADGTFSLDGAWRFTPTETDLTKIIIPGVVPDSDFLSFGYWVQETTDPDGMPVVNAFYDGSMPFNNAGALGLLKGSATYAGPATGQYVKKTGGMPTTSGQFTANANLTATFGTSDQIGSAFHNSLRGTVNGFMGANGDNSIAGWAVTLGVAKYDTNNNGTFSGDTSTGMDSTAGGWEGAFFGPVVENDPNTMDVNEAETGYPTGVAGRFNAHFDDGHVIGSFGAEQVTTP